MKLISAELRYFCQHEFLKLIFKPGLNLIVGKNGSGKSNAIKAVYSAITGDFGRNDGVKLDNISQFAPQNAISYVNAILEHEGTQLAIQRGLSPASTRLVITANGNQETVITKTTEANEAMLNILDVSSSMLSDYVFVDQWRIFDFLSMTSSARSKIFQKLFKIDKAELLWKQLGDYSSTIETVKSNAELKDGILVKLNDAIKKQRELKQALNRMIVDLANYDIKAAKETIENVKRYNAVYAELQDLRRKQYDINTEWQNVKTRLNYSQQDKEVFECDAELHKQQYQEDKQRLATYESNQKIYAKYSALEKEFLVVQNNLNNLHAPIAPESYENYCSGGWKNTYALLHNSVNLAKQYLHKLTPEHNHCPTCGTPVEMLKEHREKLDHDYKSNCATLQKLDIIASECKAHEATIANYLNQQKALIDKQKSIREQLNTLSDIKPINENSDELRTRIIQYENSLALLDSIKKSHAKNENAFSRLQGICDQLIETIGHYEKEVDSLIDYRNKEEAAKVTITDYEILLAQQKEHSTELRILDRLIDEYSFNYKQLEKTEAESKINQDFKNHIEDIRTVLHRDNLPRIAALNYLDVMQEEVNVILEKFDSPFSVKATEDLSFIASFKDGRQIPAARLSGGEKVLLALAFRVVVNDIFTKDLGLLVLDEPTAGLDEGNLNCIRIAIGRLKELTASRGLQVIMITHERDLHNMFDNVIEIA